MYYVLYLKMSKDFKDVSCEILEITDEIVHLGKPFKILFSTIPEILV